MLIGVDWGGTKIEVVALQPDGVELLRVREATPRGDYDGCLRLIRDLVDRVARETGLTGSVGVGIPGSLEPVSRRGKGGSSTWINGRDVERDLVAALGRELRVVNDADCFASSEAIDGAGAGYRVVFGVILASGTGAGVCIDGRAHHGPNNSAGDWGHNPLPLPAVDELPGEPCYCGKRGCMETWVSGYSFARDFARHSGNELSPAEIVALMRDGDRLATLVWDRYVDRVGRGLSVVVNTLDPDVFVMGGGMSNVDELYRDLPPRIARYTFSTVFTTPVVRSVHGDSSGVRGAAWLWRDDRTA
jgi:fructokinase